MYPNISSPGAYVPKYFVTGRLSIISAHKGNVARPQKYYPSKNLSYSYYTYTRLAVILPFSNVTCSVRISPYYIKDLPLAM